MRTDLPRALWAMLGALAFLLVLEWVWPAGDAGGGTIRPAQVASHGHAPALTARDTSAWVGAILARPLFSVSRRPPHVAPHRPGAVAAGQARLAGIMITRDGRRAIFAPDGGGKQMVLPEGASVNDSTIRRILPDRVTLASGAVLLPTYDRNRASTGAPSFQPFNPAIGNPGPGNPGFANPNFANPGFNPALPGGFPNQAFQNAAQPPQPGEDGQPPQVPLMLRGNMIPQRRE